MKRVAWVTFIVAAAIAVLMVLWQFRDAIWLLLFALVVAATIRPFADYFSARGMSRGLSLGLGYGVMLLALVGLLGVLGALALRDTQELLNALIIRYEAIRVAWPSGAAWQQAVADWLPPSADLSTAMTGGEGANVAQTIGGVTGSLATSLGYFVLVIMTSIYLAADQARFERMQLSFLPVRHRSTARTIWREVEDNVGAYTRSELFQGLIAAVLLSIGYTLLGLAYPVLFGLLGAVAWFIPILGFLLALIPVTIAALISGQLTTWIAIGFTVLLLLLLEGVMEPRVFNRGRFSGLFLILMLIVFVEQLGIAGLLIAPPIAVALQILFDRLMRERAALSTTEEKSLTALRGQLAELATMMAVQPEPPTPRLQTMYDRLANLVAEAEQATDGKRTARSEG